MHVYLYWPNIGLMVKLYWNYLVERVQLIFNSILIFLHEVWSFSSLSMKILKDLLLFLQDRKYFQITCWPSNLVTNTVYKLWKLPKNRLQFKCTARFNLVWKENKKVINALCAIFSNYLTYKTYNIFLVVPSPRHGQFQEDLSDSLTLWCPCIVDLNDKTLVLIIHTGCFFLLFRPKND